MERGQRANPRVRAPKSGRADDDYLTGSPWQTKALHPLALAARGQAALLESNPPATVVTRSGDRKITSR